MKHVNYAKIARNDDEPHDEEGDFLAVRTDELLTGRRKMQEYVRDALADALSDDGDDYFANKLADFVIAYEKAHKKGDSEAAIQGELLASFNLHRAIEHLITDRLTRDAATDAQAAWDNRHDF